jgi:hypothetical protein
MLRMFLVYVVSAIGMCQCNIRRQHEKNFLANLLKAGRDAKHLKSTTNFYLEMILHPSTHN